MILVSRSRRTPSSRPRLTPSLPRLVLLSTPPSRSGPSSPSRTATSSRARPTLPRASSRATPRASPTARSSPRTRRPSPRTSSRRLSSTTRTQAVRPSPSRHCQALRNILTLPFPPPRSPASYFKLSVDVADDRPPLELNYNTKGAASRTSQTAPHRSALTTRPVFRPRRAAKGRGRAVRRRERAARRLRRPGTSAASCVRGRGRSNTLPTLLARRRSRRSSERTCPSPVPRRHLRSR